MMNSYLRATVALAIAALCNPLLTGLSSSTTALAADPVGGSTSAMVIPGAQQIDAFGYAALAPTPDTGSLVTFSPFVHAVPITEASSDQSSGQSNYGARGAARSSWMPSIRALETITPMDLETKTLGSLYQLGRITNPSSPHIDATLFGGGLASEDYFLTDEGIQLEQSITEGIGIVGRATGYQLWIEKNATSPLEPSNQTVNRLNFGRFQAGFDVSPMSGLNIVMLGGHDIGDSDAWTIESDISAWFLLASPHPVNVFIAPLHNFQNDVTSSEIDFRVVAMQTSDWILLLGAGGQVFGGGFVNGLEGEGGPIVGIYNRIYQMGADLQFGYGTPGFYGELNLYKTLSFPGL